MIATPTGRGPRIKTRLYPVLLSRVHPLLAGAIGLIVICFIVYMVFAVTAVQGNPFSHKYTVHARFSNVVGLSKNDFITVKGVRVGRVSAIDQQGALADVSLSFDGITLHDDATAVVRPRNLLGETWLQVDPGTSSRPELPDGAVLAVRRTVSPVQLDEVLDTLAPPVRSALAQLIRTAGRGLDGRGEDLSVLLRESEPTLGSTAATVDAFDSPRLGDLIATLTRATGTLARHSGQLTGAVDSGNTLLAALAGDTRNIQAVIDHAGIALGRVDGVLRDRTAGLGDTIGELDSATRSVTTLVDEARPLVDAVTPEVPTLIRAVNELQSATATSDLNGYFLRLIFSNGVDSLSDPGYPGIPGSPGLGSTASPARDRAARPGTTPSPVEPDLRLPPTMSGMMDLLYGGM